MKDETSPAADAFGASGAIARQGKTIVVGCTGADEESVTIFRAAKAGTGGDLGVVICQHKIISQTEHIHVTLDGEGQVVVFYVRAGFV